jgi:Zn-dependent protease
VRHDEKLYQYRQPVQHRLRIHIRGIFTLVLIACGFDPYSTDYSMAMRISYGAVAAVLYLCAILLRELLLIIMAVSRGLEVKVLTIFAFGGLIEVDDPRATPSHELLLVVSGILCNFLITGLFYIAYLFSGTDNVSALSVIFHWLAFLFFTLGLFHFVPAYPLEGGRFLHSLLWKTTGDVRRAMAFPVDRLGDRVRDHGRRAVLAVLTVERFTRYILRSAGLLCRMQQPMPGAEFVNHVPGWTRKNGRSGGVRPNRRKKKRSSPFRSDLTAYRGLMSSMRVM